MSKEKRSSSLGKSLVAIMLIVVALFFVGCEKEPTHSTDPSHIPEETINPNYVPIDWNNAKLMSSDDSNGNYQIQFDGEMPDIHPGSILAIDQDTVVYYIFVETVRVNGSVVNITSSPAYLTDIFANIDFTLSTTDEGKSTAKGAVFYPVSAYQDDEDGVLQPLFLNGQHKGDTRFTHGLWSFEYNNDGHALFSGDNYSIYMEKIVLDLSIDMEMYMNFGGRILSETESDVIDRYTSRVLKMNAKIMGKFNSEQMIHCDVEGSCSYNSGYDLWKHNILRPLNIKFVVEGVPIILTLRSDLFREVELTAGGEISAGIGIADHAEGHMGFEWNQEGGISPVSSFANTFEFTPPTMVGKGQVRAKVWAFPRISVMLYDIIGPSFDFKPYIYTALKGGFQQQMLGQSSDYCAWLLDCNTGLDVCCGLSLRFFGYEVDDFFTPDRNIIDRLLYHSPRRVLHQLGRPTQGQTQGVSFTVYDQNHLLNSEVVTPLPQIVKFEANGQLSSEYGIARSGTTTVNWTPTEDDILYAKLYDIDGNVLAWDSVHAGEGECGWVDLGLPSGLLWATCNVGASSPEHCGNYYAWGETQPKNRYEWDSYVHYYISGLTKYCTDPALGYMDYVDNLITLQAVDDPASANLGGWARTPTKEEWQELMDNTTSHWTIYNGSSGRRFTGSNGNSIFLPAGGLYFGSVNGVPEDLMYGYYGTSSLYSDFSQYAWFFFFNANLEYLNYRYYYRPSRLVGVPIRAVRSMP